MFADDFIFNGQRLSDFGLVIAGLDGEVSSSGGEIEYNSAKTPSRDMFNFYGGQFNTVLEWSFSITKNPCVQFDNDYFNQYEESKIARWLLTPRSGYQWLQFKQDGYEDIWYKAVFQIAPEYLGGKTYSYKLTATSNCGYGFSEEKVKSKTFSSSDTFLFNVNSDVQTYILPYIEIQSDSSNFYISNKNDSEQNIDVAKETRFTNVDDLITLDSDSDIVTGINKPSDYNYYFPRLVNGINEFSTNSNGITMKIKYREPRRVIV